MASGDDRATTGPFSVRTRIILVVVSVLSLAGGFAMAIFGDDIARPKNAGNNAYSASALGHSVAAELLRKQDIPVLVSRHGSGAKASRAVLVLAEPEVDGGNREQVIAMAGEAWTTVVVLPKRSGNPDPARPQWVGEDYLLSEDVVQTTLEAFAPGAQLVRLSGAESREWSSEDERLLAPTLASPQLMIASDDQLTPLVWTDDGILLAYAEATETFLLSDPDVIANHGIGDGDNAVLWVGIIDRVRELDQAVVIDEVIHGLSSKPSIWRSLFEFPLVLVTLQVFLLTCVLLLASTRRFGKPVPARGGIEPGKEFLIDNTAELLRFGGYSGQMLKRYLDDTVRLVRERLHAPATLEADGQAAWLERVGRARGVTTSVADLRTEVDDVAAAAKAQPRRVTQAARRIHHWKEEMLHGPAANHSHQSKPA